MGKAFSEFDDAIHSAHKLTMDMRADGVKYFVISADAICTVVLDFGCITGSLQLLRSILARP